jgi:mannose-6-phosphate isomerase-like protein (cupin superfamily)
MMAAGTAQAAHRLSDCRAIAEGKVIAIEANDAAFSASNISHRLKNVGSIPASYIVCSVSKQIEK